MTDEPEQDDRVPCPHCGNGWIVPPDEIAREASGAPREDTGRVNGRSTQATPAGATSEPLDDAMTRDMDRLSRILAIQLNSLVITEGDLADASIGLGAGADEIRRLRARLATLDDQNDALKDLLGCAEARVDALEQENATLSRVSLGDPRYPPRGY